MAFSWVRKPFFWLGSFLHGVRRLVLDLLTLFVVAGLVSAGLRSIQVPPQVPSNALLRLHLVGTLRNVRGARPWAQRMIGLFSPSVQSGMVVRHLDWVIRHAATDSKVQALDLNLTDFSGGSLTQLDQVARALAFFRQHHKPIFAYAPTYSNANYLLAAQASHIVMPSLGYVLLTGFASKGLYFKGLLDKLGVNVYAFRQGKYKSAVEPLTRENMSHPAQVENLAWLHVWWNQCHTLIDQGRGFSSWELADYVTHLPSLLQASKGNAAQLALHRGLISHIGNHVDFERRMAKDLHTKVKALHEISWRAYRQATYHRISAPSEIAVVPLDGMLLPGNQEMPGIVATGPTVAQLESLLHERKVKAVVLQMDSPGGAVTTANAIRRTLWKLRRAHKPVVVSMGSLGASGAYWLSTAANAIYAHPTTLTADIGVFVLVPEYAGLLKKLGIGYSGVSVPAKGAYLSSFAPLTKPQEKAFQSLVDHIYGRFVGLVAKARHLPMRRVYHIAQGRAWSGLAAYRLGLVNGLGGMDKALAKAARLARLSPGAYTVHYLHRPAGTWSQQWMRRAVISFLPQGLTGEASMPPIPSQVQQVAAILRVARPYGLFSYLPVSTEIR